MRRYAVLAPLLAALLALLAAACGSRVPLDEASPGVAQVAAAQSPAPEAGGVADESSAPGHQPDAEDEDEAPDALPGSVGGAAEDGVGDSPIEPVPAENSRRNNGAVTIELSATCVTRGQVLTITFQAPPQAGMGMVIGFSDNRPHGAMHTGESDDSGRFVWRVPIAPTVPNGPAKVTVTSTGPDWSQEGGGSADAEFQVAGPEGC